VAGDAAVGEEVGRVGENEVDGIFGDGGEDVEAVALVEAEVVFGVVEGWSGEMRDGVAVRRIGDRFGHEFGHRTIWIVDQVGIVDQGVKASQGGEGDFTTEGPEGTEEGQIGWGLHFRWRTRSLPDAFIVGQLNLLEVLGYGSYRLK
jgi:hypothetical protein